MEIAFWRLVLFSKYVPQEKKKEEDIADKNGKVGNKTK